MQARGGAWHNRTLPRKLDSPDRFVARMAFHFRRLFPFLDWPRFKPETVRADLVAGITVALVAVPQSLAYAQLAGVPPQYGLYASVIPQFSASCSGRRCCWRRDRSR
jgi:hypothetical protein